MLYILLQVYSLRLNTFRDLSLSWNVLLKVLTIFCMFVIQIIFQLCVDTITIGACKMVLLEMSGAYEIRTKLKWKNILMISQEMLLVELLFRKLNCLTCYLNQGTYVYVNFLSIKTDFPPFKSNNPGPGLNIWLFFFWIGVSSKYQWIIRPHFTILKNFLFIFNPLTIRWQIVRQNSSWAWFKALLNK